MTSLLRLISLGALLVLPLAGCQETGAAPGLSQAALVTAPATPVTILGIDGAPEDKSAALEEALSAAAARRSVNLVEAKGKPRYQVKGYFSAASAERGSEFSYVWDVLDTRTSEGGRIEGLASSSIRADEPWSTLDSRMTTALAEASMNDLAAFLAARAAPVAAAPQPAAETPAADAATAAGEE
jgi:hypothetical protein